MPRSQCLSNINSAVAILYVMHDHTHSMHSLTHPPFLETSTDYWRKRSERSVLWRYSILTTGTKTHL